jgi:hypothetical protein
VVTEEEEYIELHMRVVEDERERRKEYRFERIIEIIAKAA